MARIKSFLSAVVLTGLATYVVVACGNSNDKPTTHFGIDSGSGGTGGHTGGTGGKAGTGGTGGTGATGGTGGTGATGGTGGTSEAGDAPSDVSADGPGDASSDADAVAVDSVHCQDQVKDVDETDVDCGGAACPGCDTGKVCGVDGDCASQKCNAQTKLCNAPACPDGIKNGSETDIDCGGASCPKCADGKGCKVAGDCANAVCLGSPLACQPASCNDNATNGTETDVDCGGSNCQPCALAKGCKANADCSSGVCTGNQCRCPTGMVFVAASSGGAYCIDQYEITYEQYAVFWTANPNFSLAECNWNSGTGKYTPSAAWPATDVKRPVHYVDWCDAWAYCAYSGKRLCGKQGGGSVPYASFDDSSLSQWTNACTGGVNVYPYGTAYNAGYCIGSDYTYPYPAPDAGPLFTGAGGPFPGTRTLSTNPPQSCQGGAPNLYDMSGNAAEWEDSCDGTTGASDNCHLRGGSFKEQGAALACKANRTAARNATPEDVGIRCCYP